jgi:hypothetical protein
MKITKTTSFVLPVLGIHHPKLEQNGFTQAFLGDVNSPLEVGKLIAVAFKLDSVKRGFRARMKKHAQYLTHYETQEMLIIHFAITEFQYKKVVRPFMDGEYSRISQSYREKYFSKYNPNGEKSMN